MMKKSAKKAKISNSMRVIFGFAIGLAVFVPLWWFIPVSTKFLSLIHTISSYGVGFSGAGLVLAIVNYVIFKKSKIKGRSV